MFQCEPESEHACSKSGTYILIEIYSILFSLTVTYSIQLLEH